MSGMREIQSEEIIQEQFWPLVEKHPWQPQRHSVTEIDHLLSHFQHREILLVTTEEDRAAVNKVTSGLILAQSSAVG